MQKFIEVKKTDIKCKKKYKNCSTNQNKASIEIFQNYEISEAFERTKEGLTFVFVIYDRYLYLQTVTEFKLNKYDLDLAETVHKGFNNSKLYL